MPLYYEGYAGPKYDPITGGADKEFNYKCARHRVHAASLPATAQLASRRLQPYKNPAAAALV